MQETIIAQASWLMMYYIIFTQPELEEYYDQQESSNS